ncbi:MAG: hypothetical protein IBJ18_07565 [Phycisphaerales bacterium]|nr:hypothetical protein [Phycisphaerales bacterium]
MNRIMMLCLLCISFILSGCGLSANERSIVGVWGIELGPADPPRDRASKSQLELHREAIASSVASGMRMRFFADRTCETVLDDQSVGSAEWRVRENLVEFRATSPNAQKVIGSQWVHGMTIEKSGRLTQLDQSGATSAAWAKVGDDPFVGLPVAVDVNDLDERSVQGRWIVDLRRTRAAMNERGIDIDQPENDRERLLSCHKEDVLELKRSGEGTLNDGGLRWVAKNDGIEFTSVSAGSAWTGRLNDGRLVMPNGFVFMKVRQLANEDPKNGNGLR